VFSDFPEIESETGIPTDLFNFISSTINHLNVLIFIITANERIIIRYSCYVTVETWSVMMNERNTK
jgi:hypothetical protein